MKQTSSVKTNQKYPKNNLCPMSIPLIPFPVRLARPRLQ